MKELRKRLENPEQEYRCDVRWWLAEGLHTDATLVKEVTALSENGFGAIEFLAIDELGADSERYGWGSEEWVHDTQTIIKEVTKHGLGASMTSGTNWSNANLPDTVHTPDDKSASKELDYTVEILKSGETRNGNLLKPEINKAKVNEQHLISVMAAKKIGEENGHVLLDMPIILNDKMVDDCLEWIAPEDGDYLLLSFWLQGTGQTASPSVGIAYTINYLDRYGVDKLVNYWDTVVLTPEVRSYIKENGRIQMYMDSLELSVYGKGGHLWGYNFMEEFRDRRGYDLAPYLPFILRRVQGMAMGPIDYYYEMQDVVKLGKVRNDFYQTMTDLYIDNMLKPLQEWLHNNGMTLRAEISYGLPFEISQPGKYVDGIETESLEFASQIDSYRGLAGVAHLFNKVFSSETGATMMNYMLGLDFYNQIIFTQFAAGVTKTVLHGYSSICGSESDTDWPGHEGMWPLFSERFGERQPAYRFYKDWTGMISRFQKLLRSGKPRRDIAILRLDYNFWNQVMAVGMMTGRNEQALYENSLMRANEGIYWKDTTLQNAGFSYDYFAPQLLEDSDVIFRDNLIQPNGPGYQAVVIYQEELPLSSAKVILEYAKKGFPIVLANGMTETIQTRKELHHKRAAIRTPFNDGKDDELALVISEMKSLPNVKEINRADELVNALKELGIEARAGFTQSNSKIFTLLREEENWNYLYAYHYMYTEKQPFTTTVRIFGEGIPYEVNCWTGEITQMGLYEVKDGYTLITISLQPGESTMYAVNTGVSDDLHCVSASAGNVIRSEDKLVFHVGQSGTHTLTFNDGTIRHIDISGRKEISLDRWELVVESWTKGKKQEIIEDRGLGYVSKEVYFETNKNQLSAGEISLEPWKDISAIGPEVSGVGFYKTTFCIPNDWDISDGAYFELESTSGNAATVYVNDKKVKAYNFNHRAVDVSELVCVGENTIQVEVASTLANQLRSSKYYESVGEKTALLMKTAMGHEGSSDTDSSMKRLAMTPPVQEYGIQGKATIKLYKKITL